jgi:VanZ family protein
VTAAVAPRGALRASTIALWGPVVAYMALIFAFSSMASPPMPPDVSDKLLHAAGYAGLAVVSLRAVAGGRLSGVAGRSAAMAWAIATGYGASDELHQRFVPGRSAELADLVADGIGAGLATVVVGALAIIQRSRAARRPA